MRVHLVYCHPSETSFTAAVRDRALVGLHAAGHDVRVSDLYADGFVLVYPTWWAGQPAMLKGWIDRVWVAGVAYELPEGANRIRPRLHNIRRIVAITTHGSTKFVNALEGEGGKRIVTRSLRVLCSKRARTTWIALYNIDRSTDARRAAHLARVEQAMCELR